MRETLVLSTTEADAERVRAWLGERLIFAGCKRNAAMRLADQIACFWGDLGVNLYPIDRKRQSLMLTLRGVSGRIRIELLGEATGDQCRALLSTANSHGLDGSADKPAIEGLVRFSLTADAADASHAQPCCKQRARVSHNQKVVPGNV